MMDLGHEWVDLLKVDIETSEWELFSDFYASEGASLPATQAGIHFSNTCSVPPSQGYTKFT